MPLLMILLLLVLVAFPRYKARQRETVLAEVVAEAALVVRQEQMVAMLKMVEEVALGVTVEALDKLAAVHYMVLVVVALGVEALHKLEVLVAHGARLFLEVVVLAGLLVTHRVLVRLAVRMHLVVVTVVAGAVVGQRAMPLLVVLVEFLEAEEAAKVQLTLVVLP